MIIIKMFDFVLDIIDKVSLPMFYGNEYVVFFYLFLLLSFYFVRKGYKKFAGAYGRIDKNLTIVLYKAVEMPVSSA